MKKFREIAELKKKYSEWFQSLSLIDLIGELKKEVKELEEAVKEGKKEKIEEELADLINNMFLIVVKAEEKYGIKEKTLEEIHEKKMKWRVPHIFEGRKISKEEELRIWYERKKKEKFM